MSHSPSGKCLKWSLVSCPKIRWHADKQPGIKPPTFWLEDAQPNSIATFRTALLLCAASKLTSEFVSMLSMTPSCNFLIFVSCTSKNEIWWLWSELIIFKKPVWDDLRCCIIVLEAAIRRRAFAGYKGHGQQQTPAESIDLGFLVVSIKSGMMQQISILIRPCNDFQSSIIIIVIQYSILSWQERHWCGLLLL